jgi:glutamate racemase
MPDSRPIGVFDSGVGGLTVLQALQRLLPDESTLYFGDLARCPYGPRPQTEVREFAIQIGDFLAERDIKLLVLACNTATAAAFDSLRTRYSFPVIGVISPGARAAAHTSSGRIGVIATDGTVASQAYPKAIRDELPDSFVFQQAASWLVPIIERGAIARPEVAKKLLPHMEEFRGAGIDTLILGCTHFPLVKDIFRAEVGPGIEVIDSAITTATEVDLELRRRDLLSPGPADHRFLVTGPAEAFAETAQAMFRSSLPIESVDLFSSVR